MTFGRWVEKNKDKFTKIPKATLNKWIKGEDLPDWKARNNILWSYHCSNDIKDPDGFVFKGDTAGKGTRFDINNKMQYYRSSTWQKIMEKKMKRVGNKCEICGSTDNLTCHHLDYSRWGGKEDLDKDLICVCKRCHMGVCHKDKPECQEQYQELMSPIRDVVINVKSDGSISSYVFTDCDDKIISAYMRDMYKKAKITKFIKNCRIYRTELEGEPNKANDRWFAVLVDNNNEVIDIHQCNSEKEAKKYKKPGLKSFTVFKPSKTVDSEKLNQIYHPKKGKN